MIFSGYSYRNLLDLKNNDFSFGNIFINDTSYPNKITISGEGKTFGFTFSGNRVLDNSGEFVWSFNSGEAFNLKLKFRDDIYEYYIEDELIRNGYRNDFKIQKIIVDTSANGLSFEPEFFSEDINLEASVDSFSDASGKVKFTLTNLSNAKVKIHSSDIGAYNSTPKSLAFENNQTGVLSGKQSVSFLSEDLSNDSDSHDSSSFSLNLNTNVGGYSFPLKYSRVSVLNGVFVNYELPQNLQIDHSFSGITGLNFFKFSTQELEKDLLLRIEKRDLSNNILKVTGFLEFSLGGFSGYHTGLFISGISITNSGLYSEIPSVVFSSFSGVSSIAVNEKNLISYNAGESFDLLFTGNGTGVSATAYTKKAMINLFTGENESSKFRTITGVIVNSGGYGFEGEYGVLMSGSIVDYPNEYSDEIATSLGYAPVLFTTDFFLSAGLASGRALLSSGNSGNLSGVIIFGAGSGYGTRPHLAEDLPYTGVQLPKISFIRATGDSFTGDASGVCLLNTSGATISIPNNWTILASRNPSNQDSDYSLILETGSNNYYFGPVVFSPENNTLHLRVKSKSFASYENAFLDCNLYETGQDKRNFKIHTHNEYKIMDDPEEYESFFLNKN